MDVITRNCPRCSAPLTFETQQTQLTCRYCGCSVEVVRRGDKDVDVAERPSAASERVVPCPQSLHVEEQGGGLTIWWRWFQPMLIFLAFFCLAWNAFLLVWYGMAVGFGGIAPWPVRVLMFVFPIAHVAVGVGLTYFVIAGFLNTTRIELGGGELRVVHGPVPWKQPQPISTDDIDQVYVTRSKDDSPDDKGYGYVVQILDRQGIKRSLIERLTDSDKALCIADRIRQHLAITPRSMPGEFVGSS